MSSATRGTRVLQLSLVPGEVIEAWADPEVRWFFGAAHRLGVPAPTSLALEAHHRAGMLGFCRLWWASFHEGLIERRLTEELRVQIATQAGCAYCATSRLEAPGTRSDGSQTQAAAAADPRRARMLAFGDTLSLRPWELGPDHLAGLRGVFSEPEVVELAVFASWQVSGPRMLRSWGAERFKRGARVDLAALPVRLAYAAGSAGDEAALRPRPSGDDRLPASSAPMGWLSFLGTRPDLVAAWVGVWRAAIDEGPLPARIGQLVRTDLAARLAHPGWASLDDPAIRAAGIDGATVAALPRADPSTFDARERAALAYARALLGNHGIDEKSTETLSAAFSEAELVQLGLATAVQIGAILVDRSRSTSSAGPITMLPV